MKRVGHQLLGGVAGLGLAEILRWPHAAHLAAHGLPAWMGSAAAVGTGLLAGAVAATVAPLPDVDQRRWWCYARDPLTGRRTVRRDLPRWLQHRRVTHWWGLAVPMAAPAAFLPAPLGWLLAAIAAGWLSHLAGDWVFGQRGPRETGWRGAGIPLGWRRCRSTSGRYWSWIYHGCGLKCGGRVEVWAAWPLLSTGLVVLCALLVGPLR